MTPTARTLLWLRGQGALAAVVERFNPGTRRRHDLFGCIDVLALDGQPGCLGVQVTTGEHVSHRLEKIRSDECWPNVERWLAAGNRLVVHGWAKRGPRGKRKVWTLRVETVGAVSAPRS